MFNLCHNKNKMSRRKHIEIKLDGIAEKLGAKVYSDSLGFVCLISKDINESVVGQGKSVSAAVSDWDLKLKEHLRKADDKDPIVTYIKGLLGKNKSHGERELQPLMPRANGQKPTWDESNKPQHVIDFENQFYPSRKKH